MSFPREDYRELGRYEPDRRFVPVDLSDNTNLWGAHPGALKAVLRAGTTEMARYPTFYADDLREAVGRRFGVEPASVCTGCGSDDVLDSAFRAAAAPGGLVRFPAPTFSMVEPLCRMNGRDAGPVAWSDALDDPLRLLEGDPVLVYVCRPNNPTGHVTTREWIRELLDAGARMPGGGPLVVVDEAYADFAGESLVSQAPDEERLLVVRTLSKAFGLAGMRVGIGVGSPAVAEEVEKSRGPYKVTHLSERAAVAALDDEDGWVRRTVEECVDNRERLTRELEERGLTPIPSKANFVLFPVASGTARDKALGLREKGVGVRPFPDCPDVGDALRVTVGPWPLMERFLAALDELLGRYPESWRASEKMAAAFRGTPASEGSDRDPAGGRP